MQDWRSFDWAGIYQTARRLQTRIAKAIRKGDWRDAKRLQRLLIRSMSGKALAVRRVTENQGSKTPGVDGDTWSTPECKWQAVQRLTTRDYRPLPLRRVHIPKTNGWKRPLGIPTMKDRAMQAVTSANSYGLRSDRSTADAIVQCPPGWGKRRHPKKGKRWIKRRYFRKEGAGDWVFAVDKLRLLRFSEFLHREHIKLKSEASPFDPAWDDYFAERLGRRMAQTLMGRRKLLWVWKRQGCQCPNCRQPITTKSGWHTHHRRWRCHGGTDHVTNLVLLHPTCHRQHHSRKRGMKSRAKMGKPALIEV